MDSSDYPSGLVLVFNLKVRELRPSFEQLSLWKTSTGCKRQSWNWIQACLKLVADYLFAQKNWWGDADRATAEATAEAHPLFLPVESNSSLWGRGRLFCVSFTTLLWPMLRKGVKQGGMEGILASIRSMGSFGTTSNILRLWLTFFMRRFPFCRININSYHLHHKLLRTMR